MSRTTLLDQAPDTLLCSCACLRQLSVERTAAGEAGGLRVPEAGMDAAGQPATAAWGALFVAAPSERGDTGPNEHEPACAPALAAFEGGEAVARAAALLRLPGRPRSNRPHPSSVPALASAPVGACEPQSALLGLALVSLGNAAFLPCWSLVMQLQNLAACR